MVRIRRDLTGSGSWGKPVETAVLDGTDTVRIIAEGEILESFVNDKYNLAARIP
jgi:hypothetical protein